MEVIVIAKDELRINEEIRAREVRVNTVDGEQLGIMPLARALELAAQHHLDLVEIAPKAKPPVCRIMDYGKYQYEQQKREKEARKRQKTVDVRKSNCVSALKNTTLMSRPKMPFVSLKAEIRSRPPLCSAAVN